MKGAPLNIIGLPSIYPNAREITFGGATGENKINIPDNLASALEIFEGSNSYLKFVTTNGSELVVIGKNTTVNGNFIAEGDSSTRTVLRHSRLRFAPGATPGTNITCTVLSGGWNEPTITDAADIGKNQSEGSFTLSTDGTTITLDITENVVAVPIGVIRQHDINSSSTSEYYTILPAVSSNNISFVCRKRGTQTSVDFTTILDAGDVMDLDIFYITSS